LSPSPSSSSSILASRSFRVIVWGSLHGCDISGGEGFKRIIIKWRHGRGKLIKLVDAHLLVLVPLVAQEHVLALTDVTTPNKHTLEHPQDTTKGGRGATRRRRSWARTDGVRSHRSRRNIHGDGRSCRFWGLRSVISWSFKNSHPVTLSIIIIICRAYLQLWRVVLEMLMTSWSMKSKIEKGLFWT
jgi:hypothetical protein